MILMAMVEDTESGDFHLEYLLSFICFSYWFRLLLMMELMQTYGPLISIMKQMGEDMLVFFQLYTI
jgi:hypothetical protein